MSSVNLDQIHRFVLDDCDMRGEIVTLADAVQKATAQQDISDDAKALLGEFFAAVSLMIEVLKFSGTLTLQARGAGPVPLIMVEATDQRTLRGIIKFSDQGEPANLRSLTLPQLIGNGVLSLTLDPTQGQRYQGIVGLDGDTLADCLSHYFARSEQLPTQLWIFASAERAGGLLLQALPPASGQAPKTDAWETALHLANTVTQQELLNLDHPTVLHRLFNELDVHLYPAHTVAFHCPCSRERSLRALTALGRDDAFALLRERDQIQMNCEFCGAEYRFGETDLETLFPTDQQQLH